MIKDYRKWVPVKIATNNNGFYPMWYNQREIWMCKVGENIGWEEDGKHVEFTRPVLILKIFSKQLCHIIPLTKATKTGKFYYSFDGKTGIISTALLSQSRVIDSSRLIRKMGRVSVNDFNEIKKRIKGILSL